MKDILKDTGRRVKDFIDKKIDPQCIAVIEKNKNNL